MAVWKSGRLCCFSKAFFSIPSSSAFPFQRKLAVQNGGRNLISGCSDSVDTSGNLCSEYDVVVIGGGHNGLVAASYMGKAGLKVCVLEKRHVIGGAAVTEEIIPGFKFSRASYVLSLLRPIIITELELKKHGLKVYLRDPSSYTPLSESSIRLSGPRSLTLYTQDKHKTQQQIAQFSKRDSKSYFEYEALLEQLTAATDPLLDHPPPNIPHMSHAQWKTKWKGIRSLKPLLQASERGTKRDLMKETLLEGEGLLAFYEFATSSATKILDQWFESEPLKATLATDGVIGSMHGPHTPGTGYVLLHHVMGELEGLRGVWGFPEGGMGGVSNALARCAISYGVHIRTSMSVKEILMDDDGGGVGKCRAAGVRLENGRSIKAKWAVLSNATPKITFLDLIPKGVLSERHVRELSRIDYASPVTKINLALKSLPNFTADPNVNDGVPMPHHQTTIHLNCESTHIVHQAYLSGEAGLLPNKPMIEMVIPSSLDPTIAPPGCHVALLFTQYTPYTLGDGKQWTEETKKEYLDIVLSTIEAYAPGFRDSVLGGEVLSPVDLERIFGLTGGNIFHGSLTLDQLFLARPMRSVTSPSTPVQRLFLCGSGAHPGGGVMGAPGRLAALAAIQEIRN